VSYYSRVYGLMCVHHDLELPEENSPLWQLEYYYLSNDSKVLPNLDIYWRECKAGSKLYNQRPWRTGTKEDYMSPDQLIALIGYLSERCMQKEIDEIWKWLKWHMFSYDNVSCKTNFKRIMQPMAVACVGYASTKSQFWGMILKASCLTACQSPIESTSGNLKAWTIFNIFGFDLKELRPLVGGDFRDSFGIYFGNEDHPLNPKNWGELW